MSRVITVIRHLFYRFGWIRYILGFYKYITDERAAIGVGHLLCYRNEDAVGPVQRDEALLLFSIVKMVRPRLMLEFGFYRGQSAFNFLQALSNDSKLVSFDISSESEKIAHADFTRYKNFTFHKKSQTDIVPDDVFNEEVDFVFFDCTHDLEMNKRTLEKTLPLLSEAAIIAVHDTGLWNKALFQKPHCRFVTRKPDNWLDNHTFQPHQEERKFVNWILREHPAFSQIHFHSLRIIRHGITILQYTRPLPVDSEGS